MKRETWEGRVLFNSYTFILLFAPIAIAGFFAAARVGGRRLALVWVAAISLAFYGWWNPSHVWLLLGSLVANFGLGIVLGGRQRQRRALLALGIAFNLGLIAYYKYSNFLVGSFHAVTGSAWSPEEIVLPLAISFFTFQQIAYLVDASRGLTRDHDFVDYCVFVTFFPQLIAGPIVHHADLMPQFREPRTFRLQIDDVAVGASWFFVGLFKKVVIADGVARFATPVFDFAANGGQPTFVEAWTGALAYTFQLYFDFSGYSDMAIGLALLFGIRLPLNFDSPYKATDIASFWQRWHMTLSRFLRDYLYIPLGGNRCGRYRQLVNLMVTMLLGGLWHGAGWTFVAWGGLHGTYLVVHRVWRRWRPAPRWFPASAGPVLGWATTMLAVVVAWVFFRAASFDAAARFLSAMGGFEGVSLESFVGRLKPGLWILALGACVVCMPNTAQIFPRGENRGTEPPTRLAWQPSTRWALGIAALAVVSISSIDRASEFLYFQF